MPNPKKAQVTQDPVAEAILELAAAVRGFTSTFDKVGGEIQGRLGDMSSAISEIGNRVGDLEHAMSGGSEE